jgi:hydrogenase maturation protein HypF
MQALHIVVKGQVQGLGFRPFVYRLARELRLCGTVSNTRQGVVIHVQGTNPRALVARLKRAPPDLARISDIKVATVKALNVSEFRIVSSDAGDSDVMNLDVLPDLACCPECLGDVADIGNRRYRYPFTNCTQCGPRYSIVHSLPYDRPRTTMKAFQMCQDCRQEYDNPEDRRFHAQPNCCPVCGPKLSLLHASGALFDDVNPVETAARLLADGRVVAIKSIGGFHIACDATKPEAVAELRKRKNRPDKPLAIMCPDLETIRRFCQIDNGSKSLLETAARPVVLVPKRLKDAELAIADAVAPTTRYWGVMLAYAPLHHLLFAVAEPGLKALVMTSANSKDLPILIESEAVITRLGKVVDYVLTHDRPIANRSDDSVVFHEGGPIIVRRAKGYAPGPVILAEKDYRLKPVLACGGQQKNTFCLAAGNRAYLSPHIGELDSAETMDLFSQTLELYRRWYGIKPELVACDLHPDYLSSRFAENMALKSHHQLVRVQHHHAHIASVIAEHNLTRPVLGIALDGTGLGDDGRIWGCELMACRLRDFKRLGHLRYLPLVGGEAAISEPGRIAASYIAYLFGPAALSGVPALADFQRLAGQLNLGANVVFTSSTGRLFDCVSAVLGLCARASFDAQAPMLLEAAADPKDRGSYFEPEQIILKPGEPLTLDPKPWLAGILSDMKAGISPARISRRFHTTFISALTAAAGILGRQQRLKAVCLSGGSFQNRILLQGLTRSLTAAGFKVYTNRLVPVNDGGLVLGQAVAASAQFKR